MMENTYYPLGEKFQTALRKLRAIEVRATRSSFIEERKTAKQMYNKVLLNVENDLGSEIAKKLEFLVRPPFNLDTDPDFAVMSFSDIKKGFRKRSSTVEEQVGPVSPIYRQASDAYKPWNPRRDKFRGKKPEQKDKSVWAHKKASSTYDPKPTARLWPDLDIEV